MGPWAPHVRVTTSSPFLSPLFSPFLLSLSHFAPHLVASDGRWWQQLGAAPTRMGLASSPDADQGETTATLSTSMGKRAAREAARHHRDGGEEPQRGRSRLGRREAARRHGITGMGEKSRSEAGAGWGEEQRQSGTASPAWGEEQR